LHCVLLSVNKDCALFITGGRNVNTNDPSQPSRDELHESDSDITLPRGRFDLVNGLASCAKKTAITSCFTGARNNTKVLAHLWQTAFAVNSIAASRLAPQSTATRAGEHFVPANGIGWQVQDAQPVIGPNPRIPD
jgi:hypothetical protein